jgi:hypothetical protein
MHWPTGAQGRGVLLTADVISVAADTRYVSFLRSFPNYLPLGKYAIDRIEDLLAPYDFDRIYGGWWHSVIDSSAKAALAESAKRYKQAIDGIYAA